MLRILINLADKINLEHFKARVECRPKKNQPNDSKKRAMYGTFSTGKSWTNTNMKP